MTEKPVTRKYTPKYAPVFRERGVRLFRKQRPNYPSDNATYLAIAPKLGCSADTLRAWCVQAARDAGERNGLTTTDRARIKQLETRKNLWRLDGHDDSLIGNDHGVSWWIPSPCSV